jgi:hypothetical protein
MDALFRYLVDLETPIYIILGLGLLWSIQKIVGAWMAWRKAVFGLEKEIAYQSLRAHSIIAIVLMMIGLSIFCLVTFIVPYLPAITFMATSTPDLRAAAGTNSLAAQETQAPALPLPPENTGCTPGIVITSPTPRQEISGSILLLGTASGENFSFYKYEYNQLGSDSWVTIAANRTPVQDGELGAWNTSTLPPGDYQVRLVVVNNNGDSLPACTIPVRIIEP